MLNLDEKYSDKFLERLIIGRDNFLKKGVVEPIADVEFSEQEQKDRKQLELKFCQKLSDVYKDIKANKITNKTNNNLINILLLLTYPRAYQIFKKCMAGKNRREVMKYLYTNYKSVPRFETLNAILSIEQIAGLKALLNKLSKNEDFEGVIYSTSSS